MVSISWGCLRYIDEDDLNKDAKSAGCANDGACGRGLVCEDGACVALPCATLSDCPGTGRACPPAFGTCSTRECGDIVNGVSLTCVGGAVCLTDGPYKFTCTLPGGGCVSQNACVGDPAGPLCCEGVCASSCGVDVP